MIGEKLGPYEILESIGSGGMGEVWKAAGPQVNVTIVTPSPTASISAGNSQPISDPFTGYIF